MIQYNKNIYTNYHSSSETTEFSAGDIMELHAMLHVEADGERFEQQLVRLLDTFNLLQRQYPEAKVVVRRFFLSDISNQYMALRQELSSRGDSSGALSIIGQPPLDGSRVAMWVYMLIGAETEVSENTTVVKHNGVSYKWVTSLNSQTPESYYQTSEILHGYESCLLREGCNIADNCLRTWFFIRDVDTHYMGMVKARKENFIEHNLTSSTHYIASTGIGGQPTDRASLVQMDAYSAKGLNPEQVSYLYAKTHLNPTYEYGVTFERGTKVEYGDRTHLIISGTASIDNRGQVVHLGDITAQTHRMIENVEALLSEGGASLNDLAHIIVYLRDVADYPVVNAIFAEKFADKPYVITLAPVCRPEWLIEMECMAITENDNGSFSSF